MLPNPECPPPITPGEVLRKYILAGKMTQDKLARALGLSRLTVSQIVNEKRGVSADTALRLAKVFTTTPEFWLNLQNGVDLYWAMRRSGSQIVQLPVIRAVELDPSDFATVEELFGKTG